MAIYLFCVGLVLASSGCGRGSPKLPPVGFKVAFGEHGVPAEMAAGQRVFTDIAFTNISSRAWPSKPNQKGLNAVNLSYHWLDEKGSPVVFEGLRTPLPHDLGPGDSVRVQAAIQAPDRSGRYTLEVTLVQEGVAWFPDHDGGKLVLTVNVKDANVTGSRSIAGETTAEMSGVGKPIKSPPSKVEVIKPRPAKEAIREAPGRKTPSKAVSRRVEKGAREQDRQVGGWSVQVGSYANDQEAQHFVAQLKQKGYDAYVDEAQVQGKTWHRVRVGRLPSRTEAETLQKKLREAEGLKRTLLARPR